MNKRVLFVDDEPNVLQAIKRAVRKDADITIAVGPEAGLATIAEQPPFAVIVSDMRMPGMNGVEFLRAAQQMSPDSIRIMLTGNSDQQTAVSAVNDGEVFRFLTKPCDVNLLRHVLEQALRQYELVNAERDLLENTVTGSLSVLTELLAMSMPQAVGRTCRIKDRVLNLASETQGIAAEEAWAIETAANLSQLSLLMMDVSLVEKVNAGQALDAHEQAAYAEASTNLADLIRRVPRMEKVAEIVRYQHKHYDGKGWPKDAVKAESIPFGARALHLALRMDALYLSGADSDEVVQKLSERSEQFDPRLLERLTKGKTFQTPDASRTISVEDIAVGLTIEEDVRTDSGSLLVCAGQQVSDSIHKHLMGFIINGTLTGKITVSGEADEDEPMRQSA
ncbi:MAG: HD domain-containing phosphohydrolase [Pseudomonadota bacterium]